VDCKAVITGVECRKPLVQMIGDVGEANDELSAGGIMAHKTQCSWCARLERAAWGSGPASTAFCLHYAQFADLPLPKAFKRTTLARNAGNLVNVG
jgi:hypothetical protein